MTRLVFWAESSTCLGCQFLVSAVSAKQTACGVQKPTGKQQTGWALAHRSCLGLGADRSVTVQPGQAGAGNMLGAAHQPMGLLPLQAWHVRPGKSTESRAKGRCWTVTPLHESSCGSWASAPAQPDLALQGGGGAASSHHTFQLLAVRR